MSSEVFAVIGRTLLFIFLTITIFFMPIDLILIFIYIIKKDKEKAMNFFIIFIIGIISIVILNKCFI